METQVGKWETVASNLQTSYVLHQSASSSNFSCLCPAKSKGRVVSVVASSRELDDITTNSWSIATSQDKDLEDGVSALTRSTSCWPWGPLTPV